MRATLAVTLLLLSFGVAWAGDYVGEDTVTPGKFRRYLESRDPTQALPQANEVLHAVSEADTPGQRAINLGQPHATPPVPPSVPQKYRKVVGGLVVEMDAAEKQTVDKAQAAQEALTTQYKDEFKKDMCKEDLLIKVTEFLANREANKHAQVDASQAAFQAEIDAMSTVNLAVAKDMFTKANVRMHTLTHGVIDDEYILLNNVSRCLLAARKVRGGS
jgi:hypothetical protein